MCLCSVFREFSSECPWFPDLKKTTSTRVEEYTCVYHIPQVGEYDKKTCVTKCKCMLLFPKARGGGIGKEVKDQAITNMLLGVLLEA